MISPEEMNEHVRHHTGLLPHQQRVIEERNDLRDKIRKLSTFLLAPPPSAMLPGEHELLQRQLDVMQRYDAVLTQRLALWGVTT